MKLVDITIRKAKPADTPCQLFDGRGLYIEIPTTGSNAKALGLGAAHIPFTPT